MAKQGSSRKIYIRLMGGLGNQMFQYAAGLHFANLRKAELICDVSESNLRREEDGVLPIYQMGADANAVYLWSNPEGALSQRIISLTLRLSLKPENIISNVSFRLISFLSSLIISAKLRKLSYLSAPRQLGFAEIANKLCGNSYLIGYFQTYRFAQDPMVLARLRSLVRRSEKVEEITNSLTDRPLIVHVRRGDYLLETNFGILDSSYYSRAIESQLTSNSFQDIWVFSDDIQAAKSLIPLKYHKIVTWFDPEIYSAAETLEIMRMGGAYIIANSSLSWWGAFLSYHSGPRVIAPDPWFVGIAEPRDLVPPTWERLGR